MKKHLVITILILLSCKLYAQKNRISIGLNSLFIYNAKINLNDSFADLKAKTIALYPTISYAREFKKIGISADFGFRNSKYDVNEFYDFPSDDYTTMNYRQMPYKSIYFSLSVFEKFKLNKYLVITSLNLPFEYIITNQTIINTKVTYKNTGIINQTIDNLTYSPSLKYGIMGKTGLYRSIYKGLYAGVEIGIGLMGESKFGSDKHATSRYINDVLQYEDVLIYKNEKNLTINLISQPTISVLYEF